ncbi:hypothetical protein MUK42_33021 [Musa troglodytarum]|uniref:Uncharacterized protein n=1 Tax=Musa troglodytarum TaxID=320322 RepID=A0A9E7I3C9_9LILI|nr:hypothetical protein MUK42_33021 [Musa troglodytarum]
MASSPWCRRLCKRGKPWPLALYRVSTFKETRFEADLSRVLPWPPDSAALVPLSLVFVLNHTASSQQLGSQRAERRGEERGREDKLTRRQRKRRLCCSTETKSGTSDHGEEEEEGAAWTVEVQ